MAAQDAKLAAALKQARSGPMFFAFIAKGATDTVLLVGKKPIPPKEVNEARSSTGGKLIAKGRCHAEEGKMIFEVGKEPPPTLANQLKATIQRSTGLTMNVEVRVV